MHEVLLQVQGFYKVANSALQHLHTRVKHVLDSFQESKLEHVLRCAALVSSLRTGCLLWSDSCNLVSMHKFGS